MLNLLPQIKLISAIAIAYAVMVALAVFIYASLDTSMTAWSAVSIAFGGSFALNVALLCLFHFFWRALWRLFPSLGALLFPDLNGKWKMKIHWASANGSGVINAIATVKQSFLSISMEVASKDSDSETLVALPKKDPESGRPILFYVYRVVPKRKGTQSCAPYEGSAMLKFEDERIETLSGNYFTSRRTEGHFELKKL